MSRNNKFRKGGTLGNLTLTPAQAARLKSDSKPVVFSEQTSWATNPGTCPIRLLWTSSTSPLCGPA